MVGPPPASWEVRAEDASAQEILEGVWRLRLPLAWADIPHVNAYALAREDGGIALVDCGASGDPSCWDALLVGLRAAGFALTDVREVVLTHYHSDHAGLTARLVDELSCPVLGHPGHAHFTDACLRPREIADARESRARAEGVGPEKMAGYRTTREEFEGILSPVFPDRPLHDGDVVASALGDWRVVETPGHSPSHICLHQPEASALIVGDLVSAGFQPFFDYGYSEDPVAELRVSLQRVASLGPVRYALPGHGRPIEDLPALIAAWQAGLADALLEVMGVVREQPAGAYAIVERLYGPEIGEEDGPWLLARVMAYVRHLRLRGQIERRVGADGRFAYAPTA